MSTPTTKTIQHFQTIKSLSDELGLVFLVLIRLFVNRVFALYACVLLWSLATKMGVVQSYLGSNDQILHECNSGLKQQSSSSKSQGIETFCMSVILD